MVGRKTIKNVNVFVYFQEPLMTPQDRQRQLDKLITYLRRHRGSHTMYAAKFFFCEALNFANVIAQVKWSRPKTRGKFHLLGSRCELQKAKVVL